ncbi:MAG: glycosyltransferase family 39 protein [Planctomycetes bacterium]|nr:glycosyltransferase family 39 protein [Planctomycetota bacterium]
MTNDPMRTQLPLAQSFFRSAGTQKTWRWFVMLAVAVVYAGAYSGEWWVGKDAALYLNLARSLACGDGYMLGGILNAHVPPGFPYLLAGMMHLGLGSFAAINAVMLVMALVALVFGYLTLCQLVHRDWALVLMCFIGCTAEMVQRSGEVLSDLPFMVLVLAALWLYLRGLRLLKPARGGWEFASLLLVAACWVRIVGIPLAAGAAVGLVLSGWNRARWRAIANLLLVLAGLTATLCAFYVRYKSVTDPTAATYSKQLDLIKDASNYLVHPIANLYYASGQLSRLLNGQRLPLAICMLVLVLPIFVAIVKSIRRGAWIGAVAILFYIGALCVVSPKLRTRYLLPISPLILFYLISGWWELGTWIGTRIRRPSLALNAIKLIMAVMLLMNVTLVARLIYQKHRADFSIAQQHGKWRYLQPTAGFLKQQEREGAVLAQQPVSYLADRPGPRLSDRLLASSPSAAELDGILRKLDISFVVIDSSEKPQAFLNALREHLRRAAPPVYTFEQVEVYRVDLHTATSRS